MEQPLNTSRARRSEQGQVGVRVNCRARIACLVVLIWTMQTSAAEQFATSWTIAA
jgi:hypothetical protein